MYTNCIHHITSDTSTLHLIHIQVVCLEGSFINYIMVFVSMLLDLNCLYTPLVPFSGCSESFSMCYFYPFGPLDFSYRFSWILMDSHRLQARMVQAL